MELPSFDPPTLAAHQLETHEVKHTPPSDRPQLQGIYHVAAAPISKHALCLLYTSPSPRD